MATLADPAGPRFTTLPEPSPDVFTAPLARPRTSARTGSSPRRRLYTAEDHAVWDDLFARQMEVLPGRAASAFLAGLEKLDLGRGRRAGFRRLSEELGALTGWSVVPVPMLIPDHVFFWHLANRRFPAGNFIRTRETFDYIEEPDVFHDVFGHVPMLTDPTYADYMQEYGRAGWKAMRYNRLKALGALYWYTVEFGLIEEAAACAPMARASCRARPRRSSRLEAQSPNRIMLNVDRVMRTDYVISDLQPTYFVIESFPISIARRWSAISTGSTAACPRLHLCQFGGDRCRRRAAPGHAGISPARRARQRGAGAYLFTDKLFKTAHPVDYACQAWPDPAAK
jgi:phenylalanine-4-hydroxylase